MKLNKRISAYEIIEQEKQNQKISKLLLWGIFVALIIILIVFSKTVSNLHF